MKKHTSTSVRCTGDFDEDVKYLAEHLTNNEINNLKIQKPKWSVDEIRMKMAYGIMA